LHGTVRAQTFNSIGFAMKKIAIVIGLMTLLPICAQARKIDLCKPTPPDATEVARDFRPCLVSNRYCAAVDGVQVFGNAEKRLPSARTGQTYYEARVGKDRYKAGGKRRLVFLINGVKGRAAVQARYFSGDHYGTFCEMQ
jgi:ribonuclease T1